MIVVRKGVLETNSSSTHSLTICTKEEYEQWEHGDVVLDIFKEEFIKREDVIESLKNDNCYNSDDIDWNNEEVVNDVLEVFEYNTMEQYYNNTELESYSYSYTTKSGDEIVVFGLFGRDG